MKITKDMIKVNTLYSFEDVKDIYYIKGYDVYNIVTGHKKKVTYNPNNGPVYPYVTLERKSKTYGKKCLMHRLMAFAHIENKPCELIEHLNDISTDYSVSNLLLSNQSQNIKRAFLNGHPNRIERIFIVELYNGKTYKGTMKELEVKTGICRATLYDNLYFVRNSRTIKSIKEVRSTD